MPAASPRALMAAAGAEWDALEAAHGHLWAALDRLREQRTVSAAECEELRTRLRAHGAAIAAWRASSCGTL